MLTIEQMNVKHLTPSTLEAVCEGRYRGIKVLDWFNDTDALLQVDSVGDNYPHDLWVVCEWLKKMDTNLLLLCEKHHTVNKLPVYETATEALL